MSALRSALGISADAAGIPKALVKTLNKSLRNETSTLSLYAPNTILNREITASRRFAAQDWPLERIRAIGKATGTTLNDVVLAMCSGAMRTYLIELGELPDTSLIAMVPVGLHARKSGGSAAAATPSARSWSSSAPTSPTPSRGSRRSTTACATARTPSPR